MISRMLNSKTKTVTFAAFLLGFATLLSRLLGIARNNLIGNIFPNIQVDIYLAAFRIPDFVYGILITGGITAAFLPVFASYYKQDKEKAKGLVSNVFFVFSFSLCLVAFILFLFANQLAGLVVPGFDPGQQAEVAGLMRIMFLSPILLGSSAIISGVLQYFDLFFAYALAPIFYNLGIIFGILFLAPKYGLPGVAFGVVLGATAHFLIQLPPFFKAGFGLRPAFNLKHPGLLKIFKLTLPRIIGSAAYHFNLIVTTAIASTLSVGSILVFNYSNDLYGFPMGLIGLSFAVAAFPALSRNFADKEDGKFLANFSSVLSQLLFFTVPLSFLMFLFRAQVIRLFYGTRLVGQGFFDWQITRLTAACFGLLTVSVFASCLIPFFARVFYSLHNTKTPVKIAVFSMGLNIGLALFFVRILAKPNFFQKAMVWLLKLKDLPNIAVLGLALALSLSTISQFLLLLLFLKKRMAILKPKEMFSGLLKIVLASCLMSLVAFGGLRIFDLFFDTSTVLGLACQLVAASLAACLVYLLSCLAFRCQEPRHIWRSVRGQTPA